MPAERLYRGARRFSTWLVWLAGALLLAAAALVTVEVALRRLFNISLGGADELSGYAFCVATALSLAYALFERAHVRVDALYLRLPRTLRLLSDFLGLLLLLGFALVVTLTAFSLVWDTAVHGSRSITPLRAPLLLPQLPWLFGWLFFVVAALLCLAAAVFRLHRGDRHGCEALIGAPSLQRQAAADPDDAG